MKNTLQRGNVVPIAEQASTDTDEIAYLRKELKRKGSELERARSEIISLENILQLVDGVFYAFQSFGQSLHETQNTYTKLTWLLQQEQSSAVEATNESTVANHLFAGLASNLETVTDTVSNTVNRLGTMDDRVQDQADPATAMAFIKQETADARQALTDMLQQMSLLSDVSSHADDGFTRMKTLSYKLEETVTIGAFRGFIELAKLDHLVFKFNIYRTFMGHAELDVSDVTDHHHCRLGNWYYEGEGAQCYAALDGFRELEAPHERLHNYGIAAIDAFNRDDIPAAIKALKNMEAASLEFLQHLERFADAGENDGSQLCSGNH